MDYYLFFNNACVGMVQYKGDGFHLVIIDDFEHLTDNIDLWAVEGGYQLMTGLAGYSINECD